MHEDDRTSAAGRNAFVLRARPESAKGWSDEVREESPENRNRTEPTGDERVDDASVGVRSRTRRKSRRGESKEVGPTCLSILPRNPIPANESENSTMIRDWPVPRGANATLEQQWHQSQRKDGDRERIFAELFIFFKNWSSRHSTLENGWSVRKSNLRHCVGLPSKIERQFHHPMLHACH